LSRLTMLAAPGVLGVVTPWKMPLGQVRGRRPVVALTMGKAKPAEHLLIAELRDAGWHPQC
jgi:hypothetical protein